jgi:biopolymer transport protein ExbD
MMGRACFAIVLLLVGCKEEVVWTPAREMPSPHHNIEHKVEIGRQGRVTVDGKAMAIAAAQKFFREAAENERMAYVYLMAEKDGDSSAVAKVRQMIERTGMCAKNYCISGYVNDPLPEYSQDHQSHLRDQPSL